MGDYKLVMGYPGQQDGWHRPVNNIKDDIYEQTIFDPLANEMQLFNVMEDPEERHNIALANPDIVDKLKARLLEYKKDMVPANYPGRSPASDPKLYNNVWTPGWC